MDPFTILATIGSFFLKGLKGIFGFFLEHWKIMLPLTIVAVSILYHFKVVGKLEEALAAKEKEYGVCQATNKLINTRLEEISGSLKIMEDNSNSMKTFLEDSVSDLNASNKHSLNLIYKRLASDVKTIPKDCQGAMNWLKTQTFPWENTNGAP